MKILYVYLSLKDVLFQVYEYFFVEVKMGVLGGEYMEKQYYNILNIMVNLKIGFKYFVMVDMKVEVLIWY